MSKKEYPSVCILDCYFEQMNKDGSYYRVSDKELSLLIARVNATEHELNVVINRSNANQRKADKEIKKWRTLAHIYKIELGRCVRKLTRIYENVYKTTFISYFSGRINMTPKECVDIFKHM